MRIICFFAALLTFALAHDAHAQYPTRPIRFIVPFPAGGLADTIARVIAQHLTQAMGQQWLVDNRPGADGVLAGSIVAKAAPDGYTLFFGTNSPLSAAPALRKIPPYDPIEDFTAIGLIGYPTFILFVSPALPVKTLAELIDYARANPGKLNYGTGNTGAIVATAQFKMLAKLDVIQIPYNGDAPTTADLMGGSIQFAFMAPVLAQDVKCTTLGNETNSCSSGRSSMKLWRARPQVDRSPKTNTCSSRDRCSRRAAR